MATKPAFTRSQTNKELQEQLKTALSQLSESRSFYEQLLSEREDNEKESQLIISKNTELKSQLAELDIQYMDVQAEKDQLLSCVTRMEDCNQGYEEALAQIDNLNSVCRQKDLKIVKLEHEVDCMKIMTTLKSGQSILGRQESKKLYFGKKYYKKLKKLNKIFFKGKKYIKLYNVVHKLQTIRKEQSESKSLLLEMQKQSKVLSNQHEIYVHQLQNQIVNLLSDLETTKSRYTSSQLIIRNQALQVDELVEITHESEQRFLSLVRKNNFNCQCNRSVSSEQSAAVVNLTADDNMDKLSVSLNPCTSDSLACCSKVPLHIDQSPQENTVVYCDRIGQGLGSLLNKELNHRVINYCLPNIPYHLLIDKILNDRINNVLDNKSNIIIVFGNSCEITKKTLLNSFKKLLRVATLGIGKIIHCALPYYCTSEKHWNDYNISELNSFLFHLINRHHDAYCFDFFDTNKFIRNPILTKGILQLSYSYRCKIAKLLAYKLYKPIQCNSLDQDIPERTALEGQTPITNLVLMPDAIQSSSGCLN